MSADVVVVGGGVIGLSAALHLRRRDPRVRVTVLERARVGAGASGASAGGVGALGRPAEVRALALESVARWPELARELEGPTGYRQDGALLAAMDAEAAALLPGLAAAERAGGVPVEVLDAAQARAHVPALSGACRGAILAPTNGQAEPDQVVAAFADAARRIGVAILEGAGAEALVVEGARVVAVRAAGGTIMPAQAVVVAAGAWAASLLAPLGAAPPLHVRALQALRLVRPPVAFGPVLGAIGRALSLRQLAGGEVVVGGGWPARLIDDDGPRGEVREESVRGNLAVAAEVVPALAASPLAHAWASLEAFAPGDVPHLGPVDGWGGLYLAAGFSGHGFALAPAVGDRLARLVLGSTADPGIS